VKIKKRGDVGNVYLELSREKGGGWMAGKEQAKTVTNALNSNRFRAMIGIESLGILISSALPAASYIYTKTLIQETLFHHRLLPCKPPPQLCNRPFLNPPFQTFLIPVPVSLSSKYDTRPLHPLANTSSKPPVPLV